MSKDIQAQIRADVDDAIANSPKIAELAEAIGRIERSADHEPFARDPGYQIYQRTQQKFRDIGIAAGKEAPKIVARKNEDFAEVLIYDPIDEEPFGVSAKTVVDEIKKFRDGGVKRLDLRLDSPGGNVYMAQTIYSRLQEWPGQLNVYIDSAAFSAASVIAMAGDKIKIAAGAWMMISFTVDNCHGQRSRFP